MRRIPVLLLVVVLTLSLVFVALAADQKKKHHRSKHHHTSTHTSSKKHSSKNDRKAKSSRSKNPLYGIKWGYYLNPWESWLPYIDGPSASYWQAKTPSDKALFSKIVFTPRARFWGSWIQTDNVVPALHDYINIVTGGDPNVGVQVAVFRLEPYEDNACTTKMTPAMEADYRQWIENFSEALGQTRTLIILQPDLWFVDCSAKRHPNRALFRSLMKWTISVFNKNNHRATIYLDAGAKGWMHVNQAALLLKHTGVSKIRGFALGATHFVSDHDNYEYGVQIAEALAKLGIHNKHFVITRAVNGKAFTYEQNPANFKSELPCTSSHSQHCPTLGKAPYVPKSGPCDGYFWFSFPLNQNDVSQRPYSELLQLIDTSPYLDQLPPKSLYLNDPRSRP